MNLAGFGVRKPVIANLVMFALIGAGIVFGVSLRREFFPETRPTMVSVNAPYPGASPDEVETSLAVKIEDRVEDLDDVKEVNTTVGEGYCSVMIEFEDGVDITETVFEVKREMDALQDLPEEVERITVAKFEPNLPTINVSLIGDADEKVMKRAINAVRDDLRSLPGMGDIVVSGVRTDEIRVEVDPASMIKHGVSLPYISSQIRGAMLELPGGAVRSPLLNTAVRTMGTEERVEAIRDIVVEAGDDGQVLRVRDVATVTDTFADVDIRSRLNGEPAYSLTVYKVGDEDAVDMAAMVKAYVAGRNGEEIDLTTTERLGMFLKGGRARAQGQDVNDPSFLKTLSPRLEAWALGYSQSANPLPGELRTTTDLARFIVGRLDLLTRNALMGGVLVLITLVLLLNWRTAFWVAVGLVVSLLGTLVVMKFAGISLNLLTMFGLIIVLGLLVDDAIVVAENITARHEQGEPALDAAVSGTSMVGWPVIATVATTICAFMPLAMIEGSIGDLLGVLPIVVGCALGVSLIECLYILPSHMGHALINVDRAKHRGRGFHPVDRIEKFITRGREWFFDGFLRPAYMKTLRICLRAPGLTLVGAIAMVVVSAGMVAGGRVPFDFLGSQDAETLNINLRMPVGTTADVTDTITRRIERAVLQQEEVSAVFASVGSTASLDGADGSSSPHVAQLIVELVPVEDRDRGSEQIIVSIRESIGPLPGVESLRIGSVGGGPEGPAISLAVIGDDVDTMQRAANEIKAELAQYESVYDIADDNDVGRRELQIRLREGAQELGFTVENVARQMRGAVFGLEAHTFPGDREDIDVRVIAPESVRRSLASIESMHVFTPAGVPVPLAEIATLEEADGYATIRRLDGQRIITVTADVNKAISSPETVTSDLQPAIDTIAASYPGIIIEGRGRQQDVADSFATLPIAMLTAAGLIYVILAALFSSYVQPLYVMMAVPFAVIGMIWGHFVLGFDLTILSLIGFIALAGVVVNDSLIFMEFFNHARSEGYRTYDAALAAGRARLRAIVLTTVTTVLGLLPLMLEQSFQARFLIPMAITISCGLISATGIILIVLPCLLLLGERVTGAARWLWHGGAPPSDAPEPNPRRAV
ncbi:MAG: efflux RND transporter permease subunit [Phycisphaerales bacterium]